MMGSLLFIALLSLLLLLSLSRVTLAGSTAPQPTCYWEYLNRLDSAANDGPCGVVNSTSGVLECCSSGDACLGDNICYGHSGSHVNGSGYYLSGCTDSGYTDSSCTSHCISNGYPDIVYNKTSSLWACCTVVDFNVNCNLPTDETWSAPAPSDLTGTWVVQSTSAAPTSSSSSSTSSTSSASSTSLSSTASAAAVIQSPSTSSPIAAADTDGLSTGAKAGISVAVGFAFLAFLGMTIAFFRARRKTRALANVISLQNTQTAKNYFDLGQGGWGANSAYSQVPQTPLQDVYTKPTPTVKPVELSATVNPVELGSWENYDGGSYRIPGTPKHDTYYHP